MSAAQHLLSDADEREVVEAIGLAEKETSGEIRVHIEKGTSGNAFARATEVFRFLEMDKTKLRNGVLIYLAVEDKTFAICGDKGIDDVVADHFWDTTKDAMQAHFRNGDFKHGLIDGIRRAGTELQHFFPCGDDDTDELSNEISNG